MKTKSGYIAVLLLLANNCGSTTADDHNQFRAAGYRRICKLPAVSRALAAPPSIDRIETSYRSIPAADVFSFTLVDFILSSYSREALNDLLRHPADWERIFGKSKD